MSNRFIIIGADNSGTTSSVYHLNLHPDIYVYKDEINFFDKDINYKKGLYWYESFFNTNKKMIGEKTPSYMFLDYAMDRIKKCYPDIKLIIFLREPVNKSYCLYNNNKIDCPMDKEIDYIDIIKSDEKIIPTDVNIINLYNSDNFKNTIFMLHRGFYINYIRNIYSNFPKENVYIVINEEMKKNPLEEYNKIYTFLGVRNLDPREFKFISNINSINYEDKISEVDFKYVYNLYKPYNDLLYKFLGRKIELWEDLYKKIHNTTLMNIGIIGLGYWGTKVLRNLTKIDNIVIKYVCDMNYSIIEKYKDNYSITTDYNDILKDDEISMVFIVTPIHTHYNIICDCVSKKKNVFVEKPICKTVIELEDIIIRSKLNNVKIFCDYIFNYSDKIDSLKSIIGDVNDIINIEFNRNTDRVCNNDNILYDLLPHDLTILYKLFDTSEIKINFIDKVKNTNDLLIKCTTGFKIKNSSGIINTEFTSNQKNRIIKIICKDKLIIYDDTTDVIDVHSYIIESNQYQTTNRIINQEKISAINYNEPLSTSIKTFLNIIGEKAISQYNQHIELNKTIVAKIEEVNNM